MADEKREILVAKIKATGDAIRGQSVDLLINNPRYGGMGFADVRMEIESVRSICEDLTAAAPGNMALVHIDHLRELNRVMSEFQDALHRLSSFNGGDGVTRDRIATEVVAAAKAPVDLAMPFLGYVVARQDNVWKQMSAEARKELERLHSDVDSSVKVTKDAAARTKELETAASKVLAAMQTTSALVGVKQYAGNFAEEAKEHEDAAELWLLVTVAFALLGHVALWWLLTHFEIPADAKSGTIAQYVITRVALLAFASYAPLWAARNYRAERHLRVVNRHRANALVTFQTFVSATEDREVRNAVLLEATRCIFMQSATGYLGGEEGPSMGQVLDIVKTATATKGP